MATPPAMATVQFGYIETQMSFWLCLLAHLRPRPCPPLGRAYGVVTGFPGLWTVLGAVFAVDRPVGAVVERLHALHHPGLVAELPAGLTAGTPLFHHPPVSTAGFRVTQQLQLLIFPLTWHEWLEGGHMEENRYHFAAVSYTKVQIHHL